MSGVDDLVAIDVHTHPQTEEFLAAMGARHQQMAKHFGRERPVVSFAEQADQYRDRRMMAVIVNSDSETTSGIPGAPNDLLGRAQADHPDVFLAFAGIDPWKGEAAIAEIRRMHGEYGIKGFFFGVPAQIVAKRRSIESAVGPRPPETTLFPPTPWFSTATPAVGAFARRRRDRLSGQRSFPSVVEPRPSVIESPSATTAR